MTVIRSPYPGRISRRTMLGAAAAMAASPALAAECPIGPPPHHKGPLVFMDYDQVELDASYDQVQYEPLIRRVSQRLASTSEAMRGRIGAPQRVAYGPSEIEKLDIYRTKAANAPVSCSFTAAIGSSVRPRIMVIRPRCSWRPARTTSRSISTMSTKPAVTSG